MTSSAYSIEVRMLINSVVSMQQHTYDLMEKQYLTILTLKGCTISRASKLYSFQTKHILLPYLSITMHRNQS